MSDAPLTWADLAHHERFRALYEDSQLTEYLNRIDRQLVDPTLSHDKTLVLRGERAGILRVAALVDELVERESKPPDTAETEDEREMRRLERTLGYRPLYRAKHRLASGGQR